jgi:NAD(P)-dependent dehydrogenase (short-subunit alcohol dehydrogenase family)
MSEKTVLVTGSTDGIGKQTALELARLGYRVILHGRSLARIQQAQAEIALAVPTARLEGVVGDFASLSQVRAMAGQVIARFQRLDALVNNAGVYLSERLLSQDGYEMHFAVNHLAPFLLTHLLLGCLRQSAPARIVTVSSGMHQGGRIEYDNLQGERNFSGGRSYSNSKLANVLFTVELAERLRTGGVAPELMGMPPESRGVTPELMGVTANVLDPGAVDTKMLRANVSGFIGTSLAQGASTPVYLVTSPEVEGVSGLYFKNSRPATCSPLAQDAALRREFWQISEQLVGIAR